MEARRGSFEILRFSLFSREDNRAVAGLPLILFSDLCTYTYIHMCVHPSSYICSFENCNNGSRKILWKPLLQVCKFIRNLLCGKLRQFSNSISPVKGEMQILWLPPPNQFCDEICTLCYLVPEQRGGDS